MSSRKIFILLFFIVILGAFLRFYKLGEQPFVTDEFLDINSSYGYYKTGQWLAWDFNLDQVSDNLYAQREERAWIYRWQVAQVFHWLPPTEAVARSVSAVWGIISIIILYFTAAYFTKNKIIGLISAFLFAVSIAGITFDRTLRMYAMFFPIFLLFSWFLFRFFEEEYKGKIGFAKSIWNKFGINMTWLLPAAVLGLLSFHLHPLTLNVGVIFIIYLIVQTIASFFKKHSVLNKYTVTLFLLLAGLAVAYLNDPRIYSFYSKRSLVAFGSGEWRYFSAVLSDYSSIILAYGLVILGILTFRKNTEQFKKIIWIACYFFVILLSAVFLWNENYGLRFIFFAMSFGIILLASGIYFLADTAGKYFLKRQKKVFTGVLAALLLIVPNYAYFFSRESPYKNNGEETDYRAAFQYFLEHHNPNNVLITRNFRSYYYKNAGVKVVNKEWKKKISLADLEKIVSENPGGWIVSGDVKGDLEKEALKFMEENSVMKKEISGVKIYRWEK